MLGVEADAEVAVNDLRDARGRPQFVGPTVSRGALEQQALQFRQLRVGEAGGGARVRLGRQAVGARAVGLAPAVQRGAMDAQDTGDDRGRLALVHQLDGAAPAAFEFGGGSNRSAHTSLDAPRTAKDSLIRLRSVGTSCAKWIEIPIKLLESVESLGVRQCGDHSHQYCTLNFNEPADDLGKVLVQLIQTLRQTTVTDTAAQRSFHHMMAPCMCPNDACI